MTATGLLAIAIAAGGVIAIVWKLRLLLDIIRLESAARARRGGGFRL
jgi:hypothetical protein